MKKNKESFSQLSGECVSENIILGRRTVSATNTPAYAVGLPIDARAFASAQYATPYAGFAAVAQPGAAAAEEATNNAAKRASPSENELNDANKRSSPSPATPF